MQFGGFENLDDGRGQVARIERIRNFPFHRHHVTGALRLGRLVLPMAAGDASRSYLSDVRLFRDWVLADSKPARDDRSPAQVATISAEMEILLFHVFTLWPARPYQFRFLLHSGLYRAGYLVTIARFVESRSTLSGGENVIKIDHSSQS